MSLIIKNDGERADLYINGSIVDDDAIGVSEGFVFPRDIMKQLDECKGKKLTVYINSYGGSVAAGLAMANMIARHDKSTTAIVEGVCCSIATQIFFSAKHRKMPANTFLMIHKPTSAAEGTADDMRKVADALDAIQSGLETTYLNNAVEGVTEKQIHEMMNKETWLTGTEASNYFNIEVLNPVKSVNCCFPRGALKCKTMPTALNFIEERQADDDRDRLELELQLMEGALL